MAIYHFSAKVISRANGSSAVASAAYRAASRLEDERLGRSHDFTNKTGVIHSEILAPEGAPARWQDRAKLWNEVEAGEVRKDAQLAREVEFSIPCEMTEAQGVALARDFVRREFVERGMVADLNVHWDFGSDGQPKPHCHVMLSMRQVKLEGEGTFGHKVREWNSKELLAGWREAWSEHVNARLAALDIDARIDHRSLEAQGIDLVPQSKVGPAGARRVVRGEPAERAAEHRDIARQNGQRIIDQPTVALDAIARQQSTFTDHDLARFIHRHTDDPDQFTRALSAVKMSPELVALGKDGAGRDRFSTREMLETERRLEESAEQIAGRGHHWVSPAAREMALAGSEVRGLVLAGSQRDAFNHVTAQNDLALVVGYAGAGKSAMLGVAREAWESSGYTVRGAALSGIAADSLEAGSGIGSRTLASFEFAWAQGRDLLTSRDVLVIDEAGMIGSRQMERILAAANKAGAKVILVGDAEQLQAIEAGAAFRALTERHGAAEITEIRRQTVDWQREATRELATGRTAAALDRYAAAGMMRGHATREAAMHDLVAGWDQLRRARPAASQVILAHTRADVAQLNEIARDRVAAAGELGADLTLNTERGARTFATGDRLMFLRNERSMGVKNGSLGTVVRIEPQVGGGASLTVRLDGADRREVRFDLEAYAQIDHGYAATIHKSQGVTVDHAHLLATDGLDRHGAYVGMSRHRESLAVHYGLDDFRDRGQLTRMLGRERAKDTTLDYREVFADRRSLQRPNMLTRALSMFAGFTSSFAGASPPPNPVGLVQAGVDPRLGAQSFFDTQTTIQVPGARISDQTVRLALIAAMRRFGPCLSVMGTEKFKSQVARAASVLPGCRFEDEQIDQVRRSYVNNDRPFWYYHRGGARGTVSEPDAAIVRSATFDALDTGGSLQDVRASNLESNIEGLRPGTAPVLGEGVVHPVPSIHIHGTGEPRTRLPLRRTRVRGEGSAGTAGKPQRGGKKSDAKSNLSGGSSTKPRAIVQPPPPVLPNPNLDCWGAYIVKNPTVPAVTLPLAELARVLGIDDAGPGDVSVSLGVFGQTPYAQLAALAPLAEARGVTISQWFSEAGNTAAKTKYRKSDIDEILASGPGPQADVAPLTEPEIVISNPPPKSYDEPAAKAPDPPPIQPSPPAHGPQGRPKGRGR